MQIALICIAFLAVCLCIAASARRWLRPQTAEQLAEEQLAQAERLHLQHAAEAESHAATASMYAARIARLNGRKGAP